MRRAAMAITPGAFRRRVPAASSRLLAMLTSTLAPIGAPAIAVAAMRGVAVITFMPVARSASLLEPTRLGR
jgi:hypothetical protein